MSKHSCPICLHDETDLINSLKLTLCRTSCGHILCQPCAEHLFLFPSTNNQKEDQLEQRPTYGNCPLCRKLISLFDLKDLQNGTDLYSKNEAVSTWPIANSRYKQVPLIRNHISEEISIQRLNRLIRFEGAIGGYGITFSMETNGPSVVFERPLLPIARDSDGEEISSIPFDSAHWFDRSMTFHGFVEFQEPVEQKKSSGYSYDALDCLLQFDHNKYFVRDGFLRWRMKPSSNRDLYPLDGRWCVQWPEQGPFTVPISVENHSFSLGGIAYTIDMDENHCPQFKWPTRLPILQTTKTSIPPGKDKPKAGDTIKWTTTHPGHKLIVWTKGTESNCSWKFVSLSPKNKNRFVYQLQYEDKGNESGRSIPTHKENTLWGNTFCQAFCVGLASYHFLPPTFSSSIDGESVRYEAYISYEHPRTSDWPNLDDGTVIPARVPFRNIEYDETQRIFKGDICWMDEYGTTWQNESKWSYEIHFHSSFLSIVSGTCSRRTGPPHRFGEDLVYINAAIEETIQSSQGDANDLLLQWRQGNTLSSKTTFMLKRVLSHVKDGNHSPLVDFNLSK